MEPVFIIAEAGVNHNGSLIMAKQLVDAAVAAEANAVKFQTFNTNELVCQHAPKADYQKIATGNDEMQYRMLKSLELSKADQIELQQYCQQQNILFLSSPFDLTSVDFLTHQLKLPLIKIASGEITHLPLLYKIAQTNTRVILSTGMSTLGDIETALGILALGYLHPNEKKYPEQSAWEKAYFSAAGQQILLDKVSLLHCTSEYPAPVTEVNLHAIQTIHQAFGLTTGYSDHTLGIAISLAAVACGAKIIEKHFTLDKTLPGPDHPASLLPHELKELVTSIRQIEQALGSSRKIPSLSELNNRAVGRKSIVALRPIQAGEKLSIENMGCKRPGTGLSPLNLATLINKTATKHYEKDELMDE
jgi:N-acetylneuraminate synthase